MNVLITGASSGFGKLIVEALLKNGHRVAGTVRDPKGRNAVAAEQLRRLGAHVVEIDVTDDASVISGAAEAAGALGDIDVLINNAGVGAHGLQENFAPADFQRLFDINVFGVQRMIRAVAPGMRDRRSGLILTVTSLLGRTIMPYFGPYNASKWAAEALTENYRVELSQFGVDVAIIEPGGFPTGFFGNILAPSSRDRDAGYGEAATAPQQALAQMENFLASQPQQVPSLVADAVVEVVSQTPGSRRFRTEVDLVGMGDAVRPYNDHMEQVTEGLFTAFDIQHLLTLKTDAAAAA